MQKSLKLFAAASLCSAILIPAAHAQDPVTATYGNTTISLGGGAQYLHLPDLNLTAVLNSNGDFIRHLRDSDVNDYGWTASGEASTRLGFWGPMAVTGGIRGFFSGLDEDDTTTCKATASRFCGIVIPTLPVPSITGTGGPGDSTTTKTSRDVEYWGGAVELKVGNPGVPGTVPRLYRNDYFIVGADIRGLDQDNTLRAVSENFGIFGHYGEQLDTTYSGGYIGIGGEYSLLSYLGIGAQDRLGLRSFITARAGLYNADVDYDGRFVALGLGAPPPSRLSLSDDELAFIGSVTLETRKQFGPRTSLSLVTDYEYISYAPEMRYNTQTSPTRIDDDEVWAIRTALYEEPLK